MSLQWTSIAPSEPGLYFAAYKGSEKFTVVKLTADGLLRSVEHGVEQATAFDLWSWPVEVPPAPVRESPTVEVPPEE
jgi:hypothetical protein